MGKALIAMSGGVDSTVAAHIMKEQGFECVGMTMKLFQNEDVGVSREHSCCSLDDVEDARNVATSMGMPYYVVNFADGFKEKVIDKFIYAYEHGQTPNPCINCNRYLKFDKLFARAMELGLDYIVTGHYAIIEYDDSKGRYILKKAKDENKDQSYVLYSLTQEQLAHTLFPLGPMTKPEVRAIAEANNFVNAKKQESQDICFVQIGTYADFMEEYTGKTYPQGDFVDQDGKVLGTHKGIIRYTIGQRKGLGIASESPYYVTDVDPVNNKVVLSHGDNLHARQVIADDINLISVDHVEDGMKVSAKLRYRQKEQPATLYQEGDKLKVVFDEPQRAATLGQAVVIYDGDIVVGGGTICEVIKDV